MRRVRRRLSMRDRRGASPARPAGELVVEPDAALAKRIDPVIDKAIKDTVVGAVVVVARDGKIVYRRAAGFSDREAKRATKEDTIFRYASMTKPIVSIAALALVDQGKLSLDDRVAKWIPEFKPTFEGKEAVITVRQLITHTSGLSYRFIEKPDSPYHKANVSDGLAEPGLSMAEFLKRLGSVPLIVAPGSAWRYSLSVDVLGEVVARAGGATLPEVVKKLVLDPVGMPDTVFTMTKNDRIAWPYAGGKPPMRMTEPYDRVRGASRVRFSPGRLFDPKSFPSGGAGLAGTANDYLRFAESVRTHRIVAPATHREFAKDQQVGDGRSRDGVRARRRQSSPIRRSRSRRARSVRTAGPGSTAPSSGSIPRPSSPSSC